MTLTLFLIALLSIAFGTGFYLAKKNEGEKPIEYVTIAILAKDKAHTLPLYLSCLEQQTWPAEKSYLYIRTNNNNDNTVEILSNWVKKVGDRYAGVFFDSSDVEIPVQNYKQHEWNSERFKVLGKIRQDSLDWAREKQSHYFVADCDNFIYPDTIEKMVETNLPIVAPFLRASPPSLYSNFHAAIDENGYFANSPYYMAFLTGEIRGLIQQPVVHCTYLVRHEVADKITYDDESYRYEYVIFSDSARKHNIPQYLDNRKEYGWVTFAENSDDFATEPWIHEFEAKKNPEIATKYPSKVIICGICRNVGVVARKTIENIEALGDRFIDYAAIIYENNSTDNNVALFSEWSKKNPHVTFISETIPPEQLAPTRTEKIARARNKTLQEAKNPKYRDFPYLVFVDLDFPASWPFDEVVATLEKPIDWDCVTAHGTKAVSNMTSMIGNFNSKESHVYWDRYAHRDRNFPLGPELLGSQWWVDLRDQWFTLTENDWVPIYAGYGGMAIFKTESVLKFSFSGFVNDDFKKFYKKIFPSLSKTNPQVQQYLALNNIDPQLPMEQVPVIFRKNTEWEIYNGGDQVTCCDINALQASMFVNGFDKFYVNPNLIMRY